MKLKILNLKNDIDDELEDIDVNDDLENIDFEFDDEDDGTCDEES